VFRLELGALDDRLGEALVGEGLEEGNNRGSEGNEAEVLRRE